MNDILRTFRLGTINLLGVTVPGLIFLFLLFFGFIAPVTISIGNLTCRTPDPLNQISSFNTNKAETNTAKIMVLSAKAGKDVPTLATSTLDETALSVFDLPPFGHISASVVGAIVVILAYVIGYIFRLSTPDELDQRSAQIVHKKMKPEDHWPYRGEKDNKFPYIHFQDYLENRLHSDLAKLVKWKDNRSKTFVNEMKLETSLRCPQLAAIIDSNEAHIRLMFGTWLACCYLRYFTITGVAVSLFNVALTIYGKHADSFSYSLHVSLLWALITGLLLAGSECGIRKIESLFHYRRVREVFDIVACYHFACRGFDVSGQPIAARKTSEPAGSE
jgi:hypothetical protein